MESLNILLQSFKSIQNPGMGDKNLITCLEIYSKFHQITSSKLFTIIQQITKNTNPQFSSLLAFCYECPFGTTKNLEMAFKYYTIAGENFNDQFAQHRLSIFHTSGICTAKNRKLGTEWCKRSAANGYSLAQESYGDLLFDGIAGIVKNRKLAAEFYKRAMKGDALHAECRLAMCYHEGDGIEKDTGKSKDLKWFIELVKNKLVYGGLDIRWKEGA
ncbi:hypothetical protein G9A89_007140 [Geosiphon pyriformis]|nr:hypothetical protein G9A89_007140 [Geosiphon pyriformis]